MKILAFNPIMCIKKMKWLDRITDLMDMNLNKLQDIVKEQESDMLQSIGPQSVRLN